jgi:acyl carrier protein
MPLKEDLVRFIQENLVAGGGGEAITASTPLIDRGIIDSMGLLQIVMFVEEQTGVRIPDDEVLPDHFQTAGDIESLVHRLKAKRSS